jgi:hypothetical protein
VPSGNLMCLTSYLCRCLSSTEIALPYLRWQG